MEQSTSSRPSGAAVGIGMIVVGVALVAAGAGLLELASTYEFAGPPDCDGKTMQPGDQCVVYGKGDSYDYAEGMREGESAGRMFRAVGGIAAGGLGALLMHFGATPGSGNRSGTWLSRMSYLAAAALLAGAAAFMATIGTFSAGFGALGAGLAAVWMLTHVGWLPLARAAYLATGLVTFAGAAYLVAAAATYQPPDPAPRIEWSEPIDVYVTNLVAVYGDWSRLLAGLVLTAAGVCLVYLSADPEWDPDYRTQGPSRGRLVTRSLYLIAAVAVAGCAAYLASVGSVGSWVGVGVAALVILGFLWRGVIPSAGGSLNDLLPQRRP